MTSNRDRELQRRASSVCDFGCATRLVAFGILLLLPFAPCAAAATDGDVEPWRRELLAALAPRRADAGLAPLAESPALDAAAQAHADAMAAGGWFDFSSPTGDSIESRVAGAGYNAEVVAAKIYNAPLADTATKLAERWWAGSATSRQSLFHGGVREVGIGVATRGAERLFVFVLATGPRAGDLPPSLGPDLASRRAAFLAALNERRGEHGLPALRADANLDRAAQEHAAALLAALRAGQPASTVSDLATRLGPSQIGNPAIMAAGRANAGGTAGYSHRTPAREGSRLRAGAIGEAVVVDALSAVRAVQTATDAGGDLVAPGYARLGVGAAIEMTGEAPHVVWVAVLTRR